MIWNALYACWGARHDDVAGFERHHFRQLRDHLGHIPDHLRKIAVLLHLAIDQRPDLLAAEVPAGDQARAERAFRAIARRFHLDEERAAGASQAEALRTAAATSGRRERRTSRSSPPTTLL